MSYKEYASKDWVKENTIPSPVEAVEFTNNSAKILVEENGVIKRVPKENVGVSGELLYSGEIQCSAGTVEAWDMEFSGNCCELPPLLFDELVCDIVIVWDGVTYLAQGYNEDGEIYIDIGNGEYFWEGGALIDCYAPIDIIVDETGKCYLFAIDTEPHTLFVYKKTNQWSCTKKVFDLGAYIKLKTASDSPIEEAIPNLDYASLLELIEILQTNDYILYHRSYDRIDYALSTPDSQEPFIQLDAREMGMFSGGISSTRCTMQVNAIKATQSVDVRYNNKKTQRLNAAVEVETEDLTTI